MPAVAMPKDDDWTPAKLQERRSWRAKMYEQPKKVAPRPPVKPAPEIDFVRLELENRLKEVELLATTLRCELEAERERSARYLRQVSEQIDSEETDGIKLRMQHIIQIVGKYYGFGPRDIKGPCRTKDLCVARHVAMYLCKDITGRSLPEIGRMFGNRDHTTALNGIRKIAENRLTDPVLCQQVAELERLFG